MWTKKFRYVFKYIYVSACKNSTCNLLLVVNFVSNIFIKGTGVSLSLSLCVTASNLVYSSLLFKSYTVALSGVLKFDFLKHHVKHYYNRWIDKFSIESHVPSSGHTCSSWQSLSFHKRRYHDTWVTLYGQIYTHMKFFLNHFGDNIVRRQHIPDSHLSK